MEGRKRRKEGRKEEKEGSKKKREVWKEEKEGRKVGRKEQKQDGMNLALFQPLWYIGTRMMHSLKAYTTHLTLDHCSPLQTAGIRSTILSNSAWCIRLCGAQSLATVLGVYASVTLLTVHPYRLLG